MWQSQGAKLQLEDVDPRCQPIQSVSTLESAGIGPEWISVHGIATVPSPRHPSRALQGLKGRYPSRLCRHIPRLVGQRAMGLKRYRQQAAGATTAAPVCRWNLFLELWRAPCCRCALRCACDPLIHTGTLPLPDFTCPLACLQHSSLVHPEIHQAWHHGGMEVDGGSLLHPLMATARANR